MTYVPRKALPFDQFQREINSRYYQNMKPLRHDPSRGVPFNTPSYDPVFIESNAREFIGFARRKPGNLHIHEFGAADGAFARAFLDYLSRSIF